jgi:hypothetical protein
MVGEIKALCAHYHVWSAISVWSASKAYWLLVTQVRIRTLHHGYRPLCSVVGADKSSSHDPSTACSGSSEYLIALNEKGLSLPKKALRYATSSANSAGYQFVIHKTGLVSPSDQLLTVHADTFRQPEFGLSKLLERDEARRQACGDRILYFYEVLQ